jgi:hypothetical protein
MNIDLRFPNTPCYLLDLGLRTGVNSIDHKELVKSLKWKHFNKDGEKVEDLIGSPTNPFHNYNLEANETSDKIAEFLRND